MRVIPGQARITGGTLEIDGQVVNDYPPAERGIAMVFQICPGSRGTGA